MRSKERMLRQVQGRDVYIDTRSAWLSSCEILKLLYTLLIAFIVVIKSSKFSQIQFFFGGGLDVTLGNKSLETGKNVLWKNLLLWQCVVCPGGGARQSKPLLQSVMWTSLYVASTCLTPTYRTEDRQGVPKVGVRQKTLGVLALELNIIYTILFFI